MRKSLYDYTCVCFDEDGVAYTGTIDGTILKWDVSTEGPNFTGLFEIMKEVSIHAREITSLKCIGSYIITASLDGKILILDKSLRKLKEFKTGRILTAVDYQGTRLFYTTKDGEIAYYEIDILNFK